MPQPTAEGGLHWIWSGQLGKWIARSPWKPVLASMFLLALEVAVPTRVPLIQVHFGHNDRAVNPGIHAMTNELSNL